MKRSGLALLVGWLCTTLAIGPVSAQPKPSKGNIGKRARSLGTKLAGAFGAAELLTHAKTVVADPTSLDGAKSTITGAPDPTSMTIPLGNVNAQGVMTAVNDGNTSASSSISDVVTQNLHVAAQKVGAADPITSFLQAMNSPEGMLAGIIGASTVTLSYLFWKVHQSKKSTHKLTTGSP